jgi:ribosomal protein L32
VRQASPKRTSWQKRDRAGIKAIALNVAPAQRANEVRTACPKCGEYQGRAVIEGKED